MLRLLEGRNVNLKVVEKEDLAFLAEWFNNPDVFGEFNPLDTGVQNTDGEELWRKEV